MNEGLINAILEELDSILPLLPLLPSMPERQGLYSELAPKLSSLEQLVAYLGWKTADAVTSMSRHMAGGPNGVERVVTVIKELCDSEADEPPTDVQGLKLSKLVDALKVAIEAKIKENQEEKTEEEEEEE